MGIVVPRVTPLPGRAEGELAGRVLRGGRSARGLVTVLAFGCAEVPEASESTFGLRRRDRDGRPNACPRPSTFQLLDERVDHLADLP